MTLFCFQSDAVKDFQGHLMSKANEVDQLRVDLQNMEVLDINGNIIYSVVLF